MSCQQDRLPQLSPTRRQSVRIVTLSANDAPSDNDFVSPLRSPKKHVKKGVSRSTSLDGVKSKSKDKKKKKEKAARRDDNSFFLSMSEATAAALPIQRIARGWHQRRLYRIMWLQNQLDTNEERKRVALRRIDERLRMQKFTFREKQERKSISSLEESNKGTTDCQKIIAYLRKENKNLRQKNQKLYDKIQTLKHNNLKLEEANEATETYFGQLKEHVEELEAINRKLKVSEVKYKESLQSHEEAIDLRQHYYEAEHKVKASYAKSIGTIMDLADASCEDDFVGELFEMCLGLGGFEDLKQQQTLKDDTTAVTADSDSDSDSDDSDNKAWEVKISRTPYERV
jgi:myosin heavy subunit